ncbi:MAG: hypothetical protein LRY66_05975 [Saccharospirillaceae bacterium]|uniref:Zinc finger Ogr/Delta-type domain-containing protein n=1 Tax=Thalassolituus pacificus TaxID=2975440 RepID=A0A9X3ARA0_9GAMM|nr:hypothetical protein [Thalassolituus pacificus]MCD8522580.1 hypothetical protein [Saccharospirillaceae bacterium]MCD8530903.1 hypothetical protein [Saccharospirillaceae bacterium]MCT7357543.1 hypothetical protein [Thalassolituus pacificus]
MNAEFLYSSGYTLQDGADALACQFITEVTDMRIKCPACQQKATVYSRANTADDINSVYARCTNHQCEKFDNSFVSHVAFSHWINPKDEALQLTLTFMLDQLPADQRRQVLAQYQ